MAAEAASDLERKTNCQLLPHFTFPLQMGSKKRARPVGAGLFSLERDPIYCFTTFRTFWKSWDFTFT